MSLKILCRDNSALMHSDLSIKNILHTQCLLQLVPIHTLDLDYILYVKLNQTNMKLNTIDEISTS